jgi:glucose/arabinose dehydrogenase
MHSALRGTITWPHNRYQRRDGHESSGMTRIKRLMLALAGAAWAGVASGAAAPASDLKVPNGFRIELLTDAVPNARSLTLGPHAGTKATVYVGTAGAGNVYAVEVDQHRATAVHTLAQGLQYPIGTAYRDGQLYVSAISRLLRFDAIDQRLHNPPAPVVVTDKLPNETSHGGKYLAFGPDGRLYVQVGSPCNICEPDAKHGLIMSMKPDGSDEQVVARGVRNSVGFDWSPVDRSLWFTDNGRDMMGDDVPSDELNHVTAAGQHFGYPYCHQGDVLDPEFGKQRRCDEFVPPVVKLGAHVAALGMRFYTGTMFPVEYRNNVFIAEHGSWNRTERSGYRVMRVVLDAHGKFVRQEPFVQGWLTHNWRGKEEVSGRPADVLVMPDGSLLVSDDYGGAIYRITKAP